MTNFQMWVNACEEFKTIIYCLEGEGDTALYKTTKEHIINNARFYDTPVFHVWIHGKKVLTTMDYIEAVRKWEFIRGMK